MKLQLLVASTLGLAGTISAAVAVWNERRMQRERQQGVSYTRVTFRLDGGWRRSDLFTPEGLRYQGLASRYGLTATVLWLGALLAWALLARHGG
ncbi:MAG TPA: hypothetical protein VLV16_11310 [Gemmatimonadales bacterium]|nr:hypothetical protein [Gemmatimonadales bacterium]